VVLVEVTTFKAGKREKDITAAHKTLCGMITIAKEK
jgi:hypothetical protein